MQCACGFPVLDTILSYVNSTFLNFPCVLGQQMHPAKCDETSPSSAVLEFVFRPAL